MIPSIQALLALVTSVSMDIGGFLIIILANVQLALNRLNGAQLPAQIQNKLHNAIPIQLLAQHI